MGYYRRKKMGSVNRTVKGYTREDGTKVSSYTRKKRSSNLRRYVHRNK